MLLCISVVQFSCSVVSNSLQPHELQHARPSCPSPTPRVYSMSIESVMPSNHLILCHPLLLLPSIFASVRVFYKESALSIRWPKYWSFTFSKNIAVVYSVQFSSVSQSCPTLCDPHGLGIPTPETCSNSYASNQ